MAINQQIIEIVTKFTDGASKKIREVHQRMEELGGGMQRVTNTTRTLNKETNRLRKSMSVQRIVAKRFQMQWLSILFFGMAMQRMFLGLIRTSLEWVGVTELWTQTLGIFFLPIAQLVLAALLPIMSWFIDAPDSIKLAVGAVVLLGIVLGTLLSTLGQVALGLAGIAWLVGAKNIAIFREAILSTTGKVGLLKTALGKIVFVAVGITIAWAGFKFIKTGIEEGSILKELGGIVGVGLGVGAIGLSIGGPWGAGIGFVIGVTAAIIMDFVMGGSVGKSIAKKVAKIGGIFSLPLAGTLPGFQEGGIVPGRLGSPVPILAHAGERVIPAGRSAGPGAGGNVISVTYNVNVSDKAEFESMLRQNNIELTESVRRIIS